MASVHVGPSMLTIGRRSPVPLMRDSCMLAMVRSSRVLRGCVLAMCVWNGSILR
jgi:hypothetical protein